MAIIQFTCVCGNNDPRKAIEYDGSLGYEATVCALCSRYSDHFGEHPADEWSRSFTLENAKTCEKERYFFLDPDFRNSPKTSAPFCCVCQKTLKPKQPVAYVYLGEGCIHAVHPDLADQDAREKGYQLLKAPVGPTCASKIPDEFKMKS